MTLHRVRRGVTDGGDDADGRVYTRVDDTSRRITFAPGPSPFVGESAWTVLPTPLAWNHTAVTSDARGAQLTLPFAGDTLYLAMLYNANGLNARLTLENGTVFPLFVAPKDALLSSPNKDPTAMQKKLFQFRGLGCSNHTAILAAQPTAPALGFFDWYSFVAPSPAGCSSRAAVTKATTTRVKAPTTDGEGRGADDIMLHVGIGAAAALACVAIGLLGYCVKRRRKPVVDEADRVYKPRRGQPSTETMALPLAASFYGAKELDVEPGEEYRPRAIALLESRSESLLHPPVCSDEEAFHIGQTLLGMDSEHPALPQVEASPGEGTVVTSPLLTAPAPEQEQRAGARSIQSVGRPFTASAADRLRGEVCELNIGRPLSPFERQRLPTAPARPVAHRFRRNSTASVKTHWSSASLDESYLAPHAPLQTRPLERDRVQSTATLPRRPPKSPHRPATGTGPPQPLSYQPFTL